MTLIILFGIGLFALFALCLVLLMGRSSSQAALLEQVARQARVRAVQNAAASGAGSDAGVPGDDAPGGRGARARSVSALAAGQRRSERDRG